ncbi:hypothetical protein IQ268_11180 [Oculatella sp. LEGE 06141]|uniref:hypothetical protein n=1 Tax=Oculatella sp. LEGE 06141 TaxID=1828648 RepID=UPI00188183A2|nr:hypothetical protein [Oculatella sp. LEGE 06141]MBE9179124.1 hypothetical protein [Oculatella sp. LEGE 06141]
MQSTQQNALAKLTDQYGDRLESLTKSQKFYLLEEIAILLASNNFDLNASNQAAEDAFHLLQEAPDETLLEVMGAIVAQLREVTR